jgi:hypothetical protein
MWPFWPVMLIRASNPLATHAVGAKARAPALRHNTTYRHEKGADAHVACSHGAGARSATVAILPAPIVARMAASKNRPESCQHFRAPLDASASEFVERPLTLARLKRR